MHDAAIVGAGVVGCAIARELTGRYPDKKIVVLDKAWTFGTETSARNSGVLHSGLHQKPGSLKARLAHQGSRLAIRYHEEKRLPIMNTGMLVAISAQAIRGGLWKEMKSLWTLIKRGREQGIKFRFLWPWGVKKIEPHIRAMGGIYIPSVWVIDPIKFVHSLWQDSMTGNVHYYFSNPVLRIEMRSDSYLVKTARTEIETRFLINAAGLYADEISAMAGVNAYKIYPWRGEYYEVCKEKAHLVRHLVYPAVPHDYPGKGIHFSPRVDGRLFLGPNAHPVPTKSSYEELPTPKAEFLDAVQRFCPEIGADDITWAYSGIRAKLSDTPQEDDFVISIDRAKPLLLNLVGIESPGLSSSMAIAEYCCDMLSEVI